MVALNVGDIQPARHQLKRPWFFWLTLFACGVYLVLLTFSVYANVKYFGVRKSWGWTVAFSQNRWVVNWVDPAGRSAGRLRLGDILLAVDNDRSGIGVGFQLRGIDPRNSYPVDIERAGKPLRIELRLTETASNPLRLILLFASFVFFSCGACVALFRPNDSQVRIFSGSMMVVGVGQLGEALGETSMYFAGWEVLGQFVIACSVGWAFPMAYHFLSRFPSRDRPGLPTVAIQYCLYGILIVVLWPAGVAIQLADYVRYDRAIRFLVEHPSLYLTAVRSLYGTVSGYPQLCLTLALLVMVRNYHRLRDPDSRRRIRWVVAGFAAAIIPLLSFVVAARVGWISPTTANFFYPLTSVPLLCVPVSIATAIWRDQLFDIKVLVRRGLQYLLARNILRALLFLPSAALALSILRHPDRTIAQTLTEGWGWLNVVWIAAIVASLRFRQKLEIWLDRRFFREAYEQEQVLLQLVDEVRRQDSIGKIAPLVSARIESVLHPATLYVFYRSQEHSAMIAGHSSTGDMAGSSLPEHYQLLRTLKGVKTARDYPSAFNGSLPAGEREWLGDLKVRLIVPIPDRQDRLVGLLLLGERMSDQPYSTKDRELLEGIASQIGLVFENQYLQDKVRAEADVRLHVLARLEQRSVNLLKECPVCGICYDSSESLCSVDQTELVLTLPVERTLDGKYRLEHALGRGGMGAVYEGLDLRLNRRVAVKVMMGSLFGDQVALRRFEREAQAAARLDHMHITRVHDYGTIGAGGAYLVLELITGRTWRHGLRSGVIEPARAAEWFRQLLAGLHFAHQAGIVHRDLKPENVMVVQQPDGVEQIKIMDFGLAKVHESDPDATQLTRSGAPMGTLGYMSPEEWTGAGVDLRADLFAIGVMVVETLTGEKPFTGRNPQELIAALLQTSYHLPGDAPEINALDAIVQRCLAKDPRDRFSSADELSKHLVPAIQCCSGLVRQKGAGLGESATKIDVRLHLSS
jgi:eukaryotic-like serine/threonine-protein kinase